MTLNTTFLIIFCIVVIVSIVVHDLCFRRLKRRMQPLKLDEFDALHSIGVMVPDGNTAIFALRQPDPKAIPYGWVLVTGVDETPKEANLWFIYVREKERGRGHAKKLIRYLQDKYDVIYTGYERGLLNTPGVRLCLSCGFELKAQLFKNQPGQLIWKRKGV